MPARRLLTRRGRLALVLGGALYLAGWAFGSRSLYPVATGLLLAAVLAWAWVRALASPMRLHRSAWAGEHVEGDDVPVALELEHEGRLRPRTLLVIDRVAGLGSHEVVLQRAGQTLRGRYLVPNLPRGRYAVEETRAVVEDPFELARLDVRLPTGGALLVYPRLVDLDGLFSDVGPHAHGGRRLLLRRPTGFDLHGVREYEHGESLRRVHWPSTARRARLMVKELEDAPRDELAVLLDAASPDVGRPPESSFELQVRAAGSILRAHVQRNRRAVLVVNARGQEEQGLRADDADWHRALELLATVRPDGRVPAATLLADEGGAAARALDMTVVTSAVSPHLADRLAQRALGRRGTSLVVVDTASFGGRATAPSPDLLRLGAAGVPVVVLRRGDDLGAKLAPERLVAHA